MMEKKINVLMCGSSLSVKGGMVSVIKNYLSNDQWGNYNLIYVPTHVEKNKIIVLLFFILAYCRILVLLCTKKVQIAHLHTAERGSFYRKAILVRTCKVFGVKTIMHHHAAEFEEFYEGLSQRKRNFVNKTLELCDVNIVLSKRLVGMITSKSPKAKVEVLYNAVHTFDVNPYDDTARHILFLGRLGKRKGTYDLLKAIKYLDKEIPKDYIFDLCGDGEIEQTKKIIYQYGISDRISHVGWIDGKQKERVMKNSCISVLPSYNEGLPMSILESMAYGIPCISTNIASIPEVIKDGENGYLIEPGDIESLANRIKKLILDYQKRKEFDKASFELVNEEFSLKAHISKLISMYDNIIGE